MLQALRSGSKSPLMRGFLLILVAGFALWGIGDFVPGFVANDSAIKAGPVEISPFETARAFEQTRRRVMPQTGVDEAIDRGLLSLVMQQQLGEALLTAEARRMGLTTTRAMERAAIAADPAFKDAVGNFNSLRFRDALLSNGYDEAGYLAFLRASIPRAHIGEAIGSGMAYPGNLARVLAEWQSEKRAVRFARVAVDPASVPTPGDAAIDAWYNENSALFNSPDLYFVQVATLTPDALVDEVAADITDPDLRAEAAVDLVYDRIAMLEDAIDGGATLREAAEAVGAELTIYDGMDGTGRDLNGDALEGIAANPAFREDVRTAAIGELTTARPFGVDAFYVAEVTRVEPARERTLDEPGLRPRVIDAMRRTTALENAVATADAIRDAGDPLAEARNRNVAFSGEVIIDREGAGFGDDDSLDARARANITNIAFALDDGAADYALGNAAVHVVTTLRRVPGDADKVASDAEIFAANISAGLRSSAVNTLLRGYEQEFSVSTNPAIVERLLLGGGR